MAHIEKYKAPSCGHMLAHYTRSREAVLERGNVDRSRTHLNYVVGAKTVDGKEMVGRVRERASWETVRKRIDGVQDATGRKVRKDAVVMADMVITAPQNVLEHDLERFFNLSYMYLAHKVGRENMMGGYVHMDETTPHMHVPFTPIKDGRFNYKGLCPRSFYQQFHKGLGDFLEKRMGYRPEVELPDERKAEKVLSAVPQAQLDQARAEILQPLEAEYEQKAAELEAVKRELAMREEQAQAMESRIFDLQDEQRKEQDRLEELQRRTGEVAENVGGLRAVVADVRAFQDAGSSEKVEILNRIADRCDGIRERVIERAAQLESAVEQLRSRVEAVKRRIRELRGLSAPVPQPAVGHSFADDLNWARKSAHACDRASPNRGRRSGR